MKTKIVLWGNNEKDEKVLIGIELVEADNAVKVITFPENVATELFYNQMMNQWREGQPVPFPDDHTIIERPLSITESLLPDELKTMRSDILSRAKTEWHFVVLSSKLYSTYAEEIQDFRDRIESLSEFDSGMWEEMKSFWSKVQSQVREKNLFKDHANELRTKTNSLFDSLKTLKRSMDAEFERISKDHLGVFFDKLQDIEERVEKGMGLQPIFNELKNLQRTFRDTRFTRKDRNDVWKRLDGAFKLVKEKKYGKKQGDGSALSRINRRYQGLLSAIQKMESSINKDKKEQSFQQKRIDTTDGQLELQIRQAKMAMIEERINSKEQKLTEMRKTQEELEYKIEIEKKKEAKRQERAQASESNSIPPQQKTSPEEPSASSSPPLKEGQNQEETKSPESTEETESQEETKSPEPTEETESQEETKSPEPTEETESQEETKSPEPTEETESQAEDQPSESTEETEETESQEETKSPEPTEETESQAEDQPSESTEETESQAEDDSGARESDSEEVVHSKSSTTEEE